MSEQELRHKLEIEWLWLTHTCSPAEQKSVDRTLDKMVQLYTQYGDTREREGRIEELESHLQEAGDTEVTDFNTGKVYSGSRRLAELKEEV